MICCENGSSDNTKNKPLECFGVLKLASAFICGLQLSYIRAEKSNDLRND